MPPKKISTEVKTISLLKKTCKCRIGCSCAKKKMVYQASRNCETLICHYKIKADGSSFSPVGSALLAEMETSKMVLVQAFSDKSVQQLPTQYPNIETVILLYDANDPCGLKYIVDLISQWSSTLTTVKLVSDSSPMNRKYHDSELERLLTGIEADMVEKLFEELNQLPRLRHVSLFNSASFPRDIKHYAFFGRLEELHVAQKTLDPVFLRACKTYFSASTEKVALRHFSTCAHLGGIPTLTELKLMQFIDSDEGLPLARASTVAMCLFNESNLQQMVDRQPATRVLNMLPMPSGESLGLLTSLISPLRQLTNLMIPVSAWTNAAPGQIVPLPSVRILGAFIVTEKFSQISAFLAEVKEAFPGLLSMHLSDARPTICDECTDQQRCFSFKSACSQYKKIYNAMKNLFADEPATLARIACFMRLVDVAQEAIPGSVDLLYILKGKKNDFKFTYPASGVYKKKKKGKIGRPNIVVHCELDLDDSGFDMLYGRSRSTNRPRLMLSSPGKSTSVWKRLAEAREQTALNPSYFRDTLDSISKSISQIGEILLANLQPNKELPLLQRDELLSLLATDDDPNEENSANTKNGPI